MSKNNKVRKMCLHCAFMRATKFKYPDWAKAGLNEHPQDDMVRTDMQMSAVHIMVDVMRGMPVEQQQKMLAAIALNAGMMQDVMMGMIESAIATKQ